MNTTWPTLWSVMLSARSREHAEALARDIERLLRETNHQAYHAVIVRHSPPELVALRKAAVPSGHGPAGGHEAIAQDLDKIPPGLSWHPGQPGFFGEGKWAHETKIVSYLRVLATSE